MDSSGQIGKMSTVPLSAAGSARYIAGWRSKGTTEILSLHISPSLSGAVTSARIAAAACKTAQVTVLHSGQLSLGLGLMVLVAAQAAGAGASLPDTIAAVQGQIRRSYVFAALHTTEFLRGSGRVNGFQNGLIFSGLVRKVGRRAEQLASL
jgi:fatty acid-binding protein DegV